MGSRRTANRRGEGQRLRAELIDAASRLLSEHGGEHALSLRAVTRAAGVAPQSFYLQFPDIPALLDAVYEERFGEFTEHLRGAVAGTTDPRSRLRALCRAYCGYAVEYPGYYRVLFCTAGTPGRKPEDLPGLTALRMFEELVGPDTPRHTTLCVWAALHGLVTLRRDRPSFPWPDIDELIDAVLAAHTA